MTLTGWRSFAVTGIRLFVFLEILSNASYVLQTTAQDDGFEKTSRYLKDMRLTVN